MQQRSLGGHQPVYALADHGLHRRGQGMRQRRDIGLPLAGRRQRGALFDQGVRQFLGEKGFPRGALHDQREKIEQLVDGGSNVRAPVLPCRTDSGPPAAADPEVAHRPPRGLVTGPVIEQQQRSGSSHARRPAPRETPRWLRPANGGLRTRSTEVVAPACFTSSCSKPRQPGAPCLGVERARLAVRVGHAEKLAEQCQVVRGHRAKPGQPPGRCIPARRRHHAPA